MLGFVFYGEKPCFLCPSDTVVQECSICGLWGGSENDTWVLELYVDKIFVRTQVGTHEERVDHCYVEGFHFTPPFTLQCQQWQCWEVVVCLKITNDMVDRTIASNQQICRDYVKDLRSPTYRILSVHELHPRVGYFKENYQLMLTIFETQILNNFDIWILVWLLSTFYDRNMRNLIPKCSGNKSMYGRRLN